MESFVVLLLLVLATSSESVPLGSQLEIAPPSATSLHIRRQNGNSDASSDLYGLGLRISAYLQVSGMLLSCIRSHNSSRVGIKLLSSAVCVALLASLTSLFAQRSISPCESWLVLSLINAYGMARAAAINETGKKTGGIAFLFTAVSVIWQNVLFLWFFTTLYEELPQLGTGNWVWVFARVDITGGFRIVLLLYSCLCALILPFQIVDYLKLGSTRFRAWAQGKQEDENEDDYFPRAEEPMPSPRLDTVWSRSVRKLSQWFLKLQNLSLLVKCRSWTNNFYDWLHGIDKDTTRSQNSKIFKKWDRRFRIGRCSLGFAVLILTIAGVEEIIVYNGLLPTSDLTRPGQLIPLILGIITFMEGAAKACMPNPRGKKVDLENDGERRGSTVQVPFRVMGLADVFPEMMQKDVEESDKEK